MSDQPQPKYTLRDPRPIAAWAPYTFFLPTQAALDAIAPGDLVKLIFEPTSPDAEWDAEKMWLKVTEVNGSELEGSLANEPVEIPLQHGDTVRFARHHVIDIDPQNPAAATDDMLHREYWERCLVDECVMERNEPIEFLYRDEPLEGPDGDPFPDSGWRIRGRQGEASDAEMEAREVVYVALGAVLNKDDSWLHLIDEPVGSAFMRDFETGEFVRSEQST